MSNPSLEHYKHLNNIFSYLLKTEELGLDLTIKQSTKYTTKSLDLVSISDADKGGDIDSRKSTTGNLFLLSTNVFHKRVGNPSESATPNLRTTCAQ